MDPHLSMDFTLRNHIMFPRERARRDPLWFKGKEGREGKVIIVKYSQKIFHTKTYFLRKILFQNLFHLEKNHFLDFISL